MVKLAPTEFLQKLEDMYKAEPAGTVFLSFKHFTGVYSTKKSGKGPLKTLPNVPQGGTPMIMVRATDGKKKKISTLVTAKDVIKFQLTLSKIMKSEMSGFSREH